MIKGERAGIDRDGARVGGVGTAEGQSAGGGGFQERSRSADGSVERLGGAAAVADSRATADADASRIGAIAELAGPADFKGAGIGG